MWHAATLVVALVGIFPPASGAWAETVPSIDQLILAERKALRGSCESLEFSDGFVRQVDANGDGSNDLHVDFHAVLCDGSSALFCGSGGCDMRVYLGGEDGSFTRLADFYGHTIDFDRPDASPPSFVVAVHGNSCGLSGMEPCAIRYEIRDGSAVPIGQETSRSARKSAGTRPSR